MKKYRESREGTFSNVQNRWRRLPANHTHFVASMSARMSDSVFDDHIQITTERKTSNLRASYDAQATAPDRCPWAPPGCASA
jgi:hypothetical protein